MKSFDEHFFDDAIKIVQAVCEAASKDPTATDGKLECPVCVGDLRWVRVGSHGRRRALRYTCYGCNAQAME